VGGAGDGGGGAGDHGGATRQEPPIKTLIGRYALLLLIGGGSALAFEPLNLWPLAFGGVAFAMDRVQNAVSWRQAWMRGWVFGAGHFIVGFNWIALAFTYQANMPQWLGGFAVVLLSLYLAVFPAFAGALAWRLVPRRRAPAFACVFAAAWMAGEWLRASLFTGLAWNPLGVVWLALPAVAQAARWIGTYGLSALLVLASGLLWIAFRRQRLATTAGALLLMVAVVTAGRLAPPPLPPRGAAAIAVRIVQPNIGQDEKYDPTQADKHERIYAALSGAPGAAPRLLLWPESASLRFLEVEPQARDELAALLGPHDLLLTGGNSVTFAAAPGADTYRNSVFALDSAGVIHWRYDKAHLVPFGEYLPARVVLERLGLSRFVPGDGDYIAGPGPRTLPLAGFGAAAGEASVGVQICYEIIFSGRVVDESDRPWFLFNPTNDAWFGSWGPPQHLAQTRLRAIEEGLTVIRAAPNGISAWISPTGRVLDSIAVHRAGVIDGYVSPPPRRTLFSRLGNWSCGLFGVLLLALAALDVIPIAFSKE
jgi:apolipoprotein N-acyltransferase